MIMVFSIFCKQFSNEASWLIDNDNLDEFEPNITYPVWLFVLAKMQKSVISLEWLYDFCRICVLSTLDHQKFISPAY